MSDTVWSQFYTCNAQYTDRANGNEIVMTVLSNKFFWVVDVQFMNGKTVAPSPQENYFNESFKV